MREQTPGPHTDSPRPEITHQRAALSQRGLYPTILRELSRRVLDLRLVGEPMRQALIDLAMHEPPLVDVDADRVYLTDAGREALRSPEKSPD